MKKLSKYLVLIISLFLFTGCALHELFRALGGNHWGIDQNGNACMVNMVTEPMPLTPCPGPKLSFYYLDEDNTFKLKATFKTCGSASVPMGKYEVLEEDIQGNPRVVKVDELLTITYDAHKKKVEDVQLVIGKHEVQTCGQLTRSRSADLEGVVISK